MITTESPYAEDEEERTLSKKEIKHIETLTLRLIPANKKDTSLLLAKSCYFNSIDFISALELFEYIKADKETLKRTYEEMLTEEENKIEISLSEILSLDGVDEKQAKKIEIEIYETIQASRNHGVVEGSLGDERAIQIDPFSREINYVTVKIVNGKNFSRKTQVIEAYPSDVVIYDSPISDEPRKFEVTWLTKVSPRPWKMGPDILEVIKSNLLDSGYVTANRLVNDVLPATFNTLIKSGMVTLKEDIETPGFFYNLKNGELINVHFDVIEPNKEEVIESIKVLESLKTYFGGHETKLATVLKWGLLAPFSYAKKQLQNHMPWLYLYGKARSGKTTLGQMILYLWDSPHQDNDMTGGSFDTVARVGQRISQNTFPIVVNEPTGAFQRISVTEMLKGAVERTAGRGRYEGRSFKNIPAFSPVVFTANYSMPDDEALARRFMILSFSHSEKKSDEEITAFEEEWQTDNHKRCKFNLLKPLAHAVAYEFLEDPTLLELKWDEAIDTVLTRVFVSVGIKVPEWLYRWSKSESMEDMDDEHREDIRIFILNQINRAYGQVKVFDEVSGREQEKFEYNENINSPKAFKERVWHVLNERLIGWMIPLKYKDVDHVALTIAFKKEVHKELQVCQPLNGLAELMGWKYKKVRIPSDQKVILIRMDKFLEFLYPSEGT